MQEKENGWERDMERMNAGRGKGGKKSENGREGRWLRNKEGKPGRIK